MPSAPASWTAAWWMSASRSPCASPRSAADAMCSFGMIRMCVGARGVMSRNASTRSDSRTTVAAISPATMLQNRQLLRSWSAIARA